MKFYPYQKAFVDDGSRLRIINKSRQIGFSFIISYEAVRTAYRIGQNVLLASSSQRQSNELNQKCRAWVDVFKKFDTSLKLTSESKSELGIQKGGRIHTLPSNPKTVRGFTGHVYLDEFALHKDQREIYKALFPSITRGKLRLTITSTPLGQSDLFHEIFSDKDRYRDFSRHQIDIFQAVEMGLDVDLDFIRNNTDDETFRQEYGCEFIDEVLSFFPYDLIRERIGEISAVTGQNIMGVDIGRKRDLTVIYILTKVGEFYFTRDIIVARNMKFDDQRSLISQKIYEFGVERGAIDATGMGAQLGEELHDEFYFIEPVEFNQNNKEHIVTTAKKIFEKGKIQIPDDRDLIADIHSIKKKITPAGNVVFDADRTDKGHADRFWALGLGLYAGEELKGRTIDRVVIF